jgi:hypothetical protein
MVCLIEHPSICTRNMELRMDLYVPLSVAVLQPTSYHYIPYVRSYINVSFNCTRGKINYYNATNFCCWKQSNLRAAQI